MMKGNGGNIVALVPTLDVVLVVQSENFNRPEAERDAFIVLTTLLRSLKGRRISIRPYCRVMISSSPSRRP